MNAPLELEMDDDQLAFQQIIEDRQHQAAEICQRIREGMATVTDAQWIEAEYGIRNERKEAQ